MALTQFPAFFFAAFGHSSSSFRPGECRGLATSCAAGKESVQKRSKALKSAKSMVDLCNDIREFISEVGLPEDCVPSMKEFTLHGRKDLANRVRRRGYKSIAKHFLKQDTCEVNIIECPKPVSEPIKVAVIEDSLQSGATDSVHHDVGSCDSLMERNACENGSGPTKIGSYDGNLEGPPLNSLSLQEKAANFVHNGELDALEGGLKIPETNISDFDNDTLDTIGDSLIGANDKMVDEAITSSGRINGKSNSTKKVEQATTQGDLSHDRYNYESHEEQTYIDVGDSAPEESNQVNQVEVQRLKEMLHQKELELSQLKKQIESEKLALSILEAKSISEIENARKTILDKDVELKEAEESLAGLKEVKIEYHGSGETVEVAGSFNGWHHRIKMDPSFEIVGSSGTRKAMMWLTVLWLYPGVYEIKFIVDGHWKIDSTKEIRHRGHIENNIIRVDA